MQRPTLLTIGIILNAIEVLFGLLAVGLLALATVGVSAFAGVAGAMQGLPFAGLIGGLGLLLMVPVFAYLVLWLAACWGSWNGERCWIWTLIILSGIGMLSFNPITIVIGVCTIMGGLQALGMIDGQGANAG